MAFAKAYRIDPSSSLLWKLWILGFLGLISPPLLRIFWPEHGWVSETVAAHQESLQKESWQRPWVPIDEAEFGSAWVRCRSYEEALALDRKLDDGRLHDGQLVLAKGGLAWRPR
jgi:hypothetical protein